MKLRCAPVSKADSITSSNWIRIFDNSTSFSANVFTKMESLLFATWALTSSDAPDASINYRYLYWKLYDLYSFYSVTALVWQ